MAITLDSMVLNTTLTSQPRVSDTVRADQATGAFDLADKRIGQQVSSTNVQLSAFGQIKSSFADVQSAAKSLSAPGKSATTEDSTKAVQAFANAFNNALKTVSTALGSDGRTAAALADNGRASLAAFDLKKIVNSGDNASDLKKIGVGVNRDGTLSVDANALQSALQANPEAVKSTLARVGAQAEQITNKELSGRGNIGGSVNALSARMKNLETLAAAQQQLAAASQTTVSQETATLGNTAAGLNAYRQMFSL